MQCPCDSQVVNLFYSNICEMPNCVFILLFHDVDNNDKLSKHLCAYRQDFYFYIFYDLSILVIDTRVLLLLPSDLSLVCSVICLM